MQTRGRSKPSATILEASATQFEMNWHGLQVVLASARNWCASSSQCSGVRRGMRTVFSSS
jgi:hypothetical protein